MKRHQIRARLRPEEPGLRDKMNCGAEKQLRVAGNKWQYGVTVRKELLHLRGIQPKGWILSLTVGVGKSQGWPRTETSWATLPSVVQPGAWLPDCRCRTTLGRWWGFWRIRRWDQGRGMASLRKLFITKGLWWGSSACWDPYGNYHFFGAIMPSSWAWKTKPNSVNIWNLQPNTTSWEVIKVSGKSNPNAATPSVFPFIPNSVFSRWAGLWLGIQSCCIRRNQSCPGFHTIAAQCVIYGIEKEIE